jgi:hypothetical protein
MMNRHLMSHGIDAISVSRRPPPAARCQESNSSMVDFRA